MSSVEEEDICHYNYLWDSSVGITTGWAAGVRFRRGQEIFLFCIASRPALNPTQPPIQCVHAGKAAGV
jgi:hypothetical protein